MSKSDSRLTLEKIAVLNERAIDILQTIKRYYPNSYMVGGWSYKGEGSIKRIIIVGEPKLTRKWFGLFGPIILKEGAHIATIYLCDVGNKGAFDWLGELPTCSLKKNLIEEFGRDGIKGVEKIAG